MKSSEFWQRTLLHFLWYVQPGRILVTV